MPQAKSTPATADSTSATQAAIEVKFELVHAAIQLSKKHNITNLGFLKKQLRLSYPEESDEDFDRALGFWGQRERALARMGN